MNRFFPASAALAALLLAAACRDEPTVAEKFNTLRVEIENKAQVLDSESENVVAAEERRLAEEANALFSQNANLLGNDADAAVDVDSGEVALDPPRK
jgi:hypothetical protein